MEDTVLSSSQAELCQGAIFIVFFFLLTRFHGLFCFSLIEWKGMGHVELSGGQIGDPQGQAGSWGGS